MLALERVICHNSRQDGYVRRHLDPDSHAERGRCRSGVTRDDRYLLRPGRPQSAAKSGHRAPRVEIVIYDIELDLDDPALMRAKVCALMAEHAEIPSRGFDSSRLRNDLHRRIDALLDRHAMVTASFDDLPVA